MSGVRSMINLEIFRVVEFNNFLVADKVDYNVYYRPGAEERLYTMYVEKPVRLKLSLDMIMYLPKFCIIHYAEPMLLLRADMLDRGWKG